MVGCDRLPHETQRIGGKIVIFFIVMLLVFKNTHFLSTYILFRLFPFYFIESLTLFFILLFFLSLSLSYIRAPTSPSFSLSHTQSFPLSFSLSHTHTHTLSHSLFLVCYISSQTIGVVMVDQHAASIVSAITP